VEQEARSFFEKHPDNLFLILDDAESLHRGKFGATAQPVWPNFPTSIENIVVEQGNSGPVVI
jgi:hypothetical protein